MSIITTECAPPVGTDLLVQIKRNLFPLSTTQPAPSKYPCWKIKSQRWYLWSTRRGKITSKHLWWWKVQVSGMTCWDLFAAGIRPKGERAGEVGPATVALAGGTSVGTDARWWRGMIRAEGVEGGGPRAWAYYRWWWSRPEDGTWIKVAAEGRRSHVIRLEKLLTGVKSQPSHTDLYALFVLFYLFV